MNLGALSKYKDMYVTWGFLNTMYVSIMPARCNSLFYDTQIFDPRLDVNNVYKTQSVCVIMTLFFLIPLLGLLVENCIVQMIIPYIKQLIYV
jgi:hypothetical protein